MTAMEVHPGFWSNLPGLGWLFLLLLGNAFFVGAEFAVISARRSQIEPRAAEGSRAAKTTLWAMEHATLMLATSQLGITVCSLLILSVSEPAIAGMLAVPFGLTPMSATVAAVVSFVVALVLVTYLHVVFGEMVPKNMSFSVPDRAALILAPPLVAVSKVFRPVIWVLNEIANVVVKLCGVEPKDEAASVFTLEEVEAIAAQSRREGTLDEDAGTLMRAFEFTDKSVADVEVPLAEMQTLDAGFTPADVHRAVVDHGHSRFVVCTDGEPTGYLHMKDVMDIAPGDYDQPVPAKRVRRLVAVDRRAEIEDALDRMRQYGVHVARTVDEHGTAHGILFLEDVLEVLVGEVSDVTA